LQFSWVLCCKCKIYRLTLSDNTTLGVTAEHPIYSLDRQGFVLAADLREGERLLTKTGNLSIVPKEIGQQSQPVYNLEIRQWHNFLVGSSGVVVHNGCNDADDFFDGYAMEQGNQKEEKVERFKELFKKLSNDPTDADALSTLFDPNQPIYAVTVDGVKYLINGHHRLEAAQRAGYKGKIFYEEIPLEKTAYKTISELKFNAKKWKK
jgi:hypothetical protein